MGADDKEMEESTTALDAANLLYRLETLPAISGAFFVDSASDDVSSVF